MNPSLPQCIGDDLADGSAVSMQIQPLIGRNEFSKIVSSSENLKKKRWPSSRILLMISCISSCLSKINWDNFHLSFHASIKKDNSSKTVIFGKCKKSIFIELIFCWSQRPRWHLWCTTCIFHPGVSSKLSHWPARVPTRPPIGRGAGRAICGVDHNPHIIL